MMNPSKRGYIQTAPSFSGRFQIGVAHPAMTLLLLLIHLILTFCHSYFMAKTPIHLATPEHQKIHLIQTPWLNQLPSSIHLHHMRTQWNEDKQLIEFDCSGSLSSMLSSMKRMNQQKNSCLTQSNIEKRPDGLLHWLGHDTQYNH